MAYDTKSNGGIYFVVTADKTLSIIGASDFNGFMGYDSGISYQLRTILGEQYKTTSIAPKAFYQNKNIPTNQQSWESDEFWIRGTNITSIGDEAFSGSNLKNIHIDCPAVIRWCAFKDCSSLATVTLSRVTKINGEAFSGCSFSSIDIPASVNYIAESAFINSSALKTITVAAENENYASNSFGFLFDKNYKRLQFVPPYTATTSIDDSHLGRETYGETVNKIGDYAFWGAKTVKEVSVPYGVTRLGTRTFYNATALEAVRIPSSVTNFSDCTLLFNGCTGLKYVCINLAAGFELGDFQMGGYVPKETCIIYVPRGCVSAYQSDKWWKLFPNIKEGAFDRIAPEGFAYTCNEDGSQATVVRGVWKGEVIGSGREKINVAGFQPGPCHVGQTTITKVDVQAFYGNKTVKEISLYDGITEFISADNDEIGTFGGCTNLTKINIPSSLQKIPKYCFQETALTEMLVPCTIREISPFAFYRSKIETLLVSSRLENVRDFSFLVGMDKLKNLILNVPSERVTFTNSWADRHWNPLYSDVNVYVPVGDYTATEHVEAYQAMEPFKNAKVQMGAYDLQFGENGKNGYLTVTNIIAKKAKFVMGPDQSVIESATLGTSVDQISKKSFTATELQQYAFYDASNMESFTLETDLTDIPAYSFAGTLKLTSFPFDDPHCKPGKIGDLAFMHSGISGDLVLPKSLEYIGDLPFTDTELNSITLPKDNNIWSGTERLYFTQNENFRYYVPLEFFATTFENMMNYSRVEALDTDLDNDMRLGMESLMVPYVQSDNEWELLSMPPTFYDADNHSAKNGISYMPLLTEGARLWVVAAGTSLFDSNGQITGLTEVVDDGSGKLYSAGWEQGFLAKLEPGKMYKLARTETSVTNPALPAYNALVATWQPNPYDAASYWFIPENHEGYDYVLDASGDEPVFRKWSSEGFDYGDAYLSFFPYSTELTLPLPDVLGIFGAPTLRGDVNSDGDVGIGDIVAITNVMAGIENDGVVKARADVTEDGEVGIGDIVAVTNIMAGIALEIGDKTPAGVVAVDLGLPSGTKWANMNVGASSTSDFGSFFAWGETSPKSSYSWSNYQYGSSASDVTSLGSSIAGTAYDAAKIAWGNKWCMPTEAQFQELFDNTTCRWTSYDDVIQGYEFTSNLNGQILFLPATGYFDGSEHFNENITAQYWTASEAPGEGLGKVAMANYVNEVDEYNLQVYDDYRSFGFAIRPVLK